MGRLAIIGTGGHARECIEAARAAGYAVTCLLDENEDRWGQQVLDAPVAPGGLRAIRELDSDIELLVAVGDNRARQRIAGDLPDAAFATLIHPFSWISPSAVIGEGAMIFAGCVVQAECRVGRHAILNTSASLSHDCTVGDFSHVAVGAHLPGNVNVGAGTLIGAGATARPGVSVGAWATVGAGSAIVSDIPDGAVAFGSGNARAR